MTREVRPLWQLLLDTANQKDNQRPLTCAECFEILDYLAENLPSDDNVDDTKLILLAAKRHLSSCPDCQTYYQNRLQVMEEQLDQSDM
ncbi:MAG: hypothetical protein AAF490_26880 [Chloroflexota bacterium]